MGNCVQMNPLQNGTLKMSEKDSPRCCEEVAKFLKDNEIVSVHFGKRTGFCVMKWQSYHKKMTEILDCSQFQEIASARDNNALKI